MSTLICDDGSPSARHALSVAARSGNGEPATLLHMLSSPERIPPDSSGASAPDPSPLVAQRTALVHHARRPVLVAPSAGA